MVSVGGLAAIINVVVLFTVAVADRAIELTVRNFAASSLKTRKSAPIVHDSDTWLPNLPRSIVKYYRHPGSFHLITTLERAATDSVLTANFSCYLCLSVAHITAILVTVLCTVLLIASEIVTEIGVDVSDTCKPVKMRGSVITHGDISGQVTIVEKGASAFLLQNLSFFDGPLKRVPAGIPRRIRGNECLSCMDKDRKSYPDIVNNCSIEKSHVYETGELEIGVDGSGDSPFGNVTFGFRETRENGKKFIANEDLLHGDITFNGANYAAFIFYATSSSSTDEVTYFEYFGQDHIPDLINTVKNPNQRKVWEKTQASVSTWKIKCEINELSARNFQTALSVYRTIQLENPVNPAAFDESAMRFVQMKEEDIYRASLSIKVIDDGYADGEYFVYTTCGVYRWNFIIPMTICLVLVLGLGLVSIMLSPDKSIVRSIPYNSRTWFRHARKADDDEEEFDPEMQTIQEHYMSSMSHEMILLEFGHRPGAVPRIGLRSKAGCNRKETEYRESPSPPSESNYSW